MADLPLRSVAVKVSGYVPVVPAAGLPIRIRPRVLWCMNVTPSGSAPVCVNDFTHHGGHYRTMSVKVWVTDLPLRSVAAKVSGYVPAVPPAGVPSRRANWPPVFVNATPAGSAPVCVNVTAPLPPTVFKKNVSARPTKKVAEAALVIRSGRPTPGSEATKTPPLNDGTKGKKLSNQARSALKTWTCGPPPVRRR